MKWQFGMALFFLSGPMVMAGPGERGRPEIIPLFEDWAGRESQYAEPPYHPHDAELSVFELNGEELPLSSLWQDKPLLLVHSSLTCPVSRDNSPHIERIREQFADEIEVVILYTREAHPIGSPSPYSEGGRSEWITDRNLEEDYLVEEPVDIETRIERAKEYQARVGTASRIVVDGMDNAVWNYFGGGPNCGMFIRLDGRVGFRQGWIKPPEMAGRIRGSIVSAERLEIRKRIKQEGFGWLAADLDLEEIRRALVKIPELATYRENSRMAYHDESLLHLSINEGKLDLAALLLEHGTPVDIQDQDGKTPLHYALSGGQKSAGANPESAVRFLLDHGAAIRARSDDLRSSLHHAVASGKVAAVAHAIEAGALLDAYSIDGVSPLHDAFFFGHGEIATFLVQEGAAIDVHSAAALGDRVQVERYLRVAPLDWRRFQGDSGRTPLMYAAIAGQREMVELLLARQSEDKRYSNEHLNACASKALQFGRGKTARTLVTQARPLDGEMAPEPVQSLSPQVPWDSFWDRPEPLLHEAARADESEVVAALLARGWDVDGLDADEETALHIAAASGSVKSIRLLIAEGANLESKSGRQRMYPCGPPHRERKDRTALHFAAKGGHVVVVKLLLQSGARVDAEDAQGMTALKLLHPELESSGEVSRLLLEAEAQSTTESARPSSQGKVIEPTT